MSDTTGGFEVDSAERLSGVSGAPALAPENVRIQQGKLLIPPWLFTLCIH